MDWFDDWALTLAVFVPAVGMALVLLIPRAQEQAIKATALLTALVTGAVGVGILARFDYDAPGQAAVPGERAVDQGHPQPVPAGHRRDLAAAADPLDAHRDRLHRLLVGSLPRAAQPEGVPRARAAARGRAERHVRRPGPDPLLHLLRARPAADVLHDRCLGRAEPRVRVDQVLPVHPVRLGADARRASWRCSSCRSARRSTWSALEQLRAVRDLARHADARVRRALPRLRDQGADVPVPHVAARTRTPRRRRSAR